MALSEDLNLIQRFLTDYILPVCFALGVAGNLFNIIVFCQKHLRSNSCAVYFISTSIFNLLVMLCGIMPIVLTSYLSYDHASYSSGYCKFRSYIVHVLMMMSRSSVALACLDRFALCSPHRHIRALSQYHIAVRLVALTSFLWLLIPIHMLVHVDIQMPARRCGGTGIYSTIYSIYAAMVTAIPLLVMVIFSALAVRNLRRVRCRVHPNIVRYDSSIHQNIRIKKRDVQFIVILISEVVIYFISTVLFPVYSMYMAATASLSKTATRLAIEGLIRYMTLSFLLYINSCSIFYVHLLASKAFRQECKLVILRLCRRQPTNINLLINTEMSNKRNQFHCMPNQPRWK